MEDNEVDTALELFTPHSDEEITIQLNFPVAEQFTETLILVEVQVYNFDTECETPSNVDSEPMPMPTGLILGQMENAVSKPVVPDSCLLSSFASNSVPTDSMMLHPSAFQNTINDALADVSFSADSRSECDGVIIPNVPSSDNEIDAASIATTSKEDLQCAHDDLVQSEMRRYGTNVCKIHPQQFVQQSDFMNRIAAVALKACEVN